MDKVLKNTVIKLMEEETKNPDKEDESYTKEVLPDYNPLAKEADNVFRKESIVPKELNEFINYKELHKVLKEGQEISEAIKEKYEMTTIHCMRYLVEEEKGKRTWSRSIVNAKLKHHKFRARAAIYMTYLIRLYRCGNVIRMNNKEMEENLGIPKDI